MGLFSQEVRLPLEVLVDDAYRNLKPRLVKDNFVHILYININFNTRIPEIASRFIVFEGVLTLLQKNGFKILNIIPASSGGDSQWTVSEFVVTYTSY